MDAIATHNLTKRYGENAALKNLALRVSASRLFGFLGPNGAGKTTAIRLLLGLLRPTHGSAYVLGRDSWRDGPTLRREVGYLPGDVRFYDGHTGRGVLRFFDHVRESNAEEAIARLARRFDLDLDKRIRNYSRGMKQKLGIIAALMHQPRLLILDEPTTGLDPLMREVLYTELRAIAAEGRTVIFSSHTLAEVEALCDEVAILRDGELVEHERMDVLRQRAIRHVDLRFTTSDATSTSPPAEMNVLERSPRGWRATWHGDVAALTRWLATQSLEDVVIAPPDLDDLFMAYYDTSRAADVEVAR